MKTFTFPVIDDEDISWASKCLGLGENAFSGADGNDPRKDILKSPNTIDVESCPGSGKTTLVVAKLAILARDWKSTAQGICVLSHTNAARQEIEQLLAREPRASALLRYPHFVGTIHSFANEFLALPALRSRGHKSIVIDDVLCEQHRRKLLSQRRFAALRTWVERNETRTNVVKGWRIGSVECGLVKKDGSAVFTGPTGPSAVQLAILGRACAEDGYSCFSESFIWANDLMQRFPEVKAALRERFPIVFVDEAQDNDADQTLFLHRLFLEGSHPSTCQRFGDSNQAIYNDDDAAAATGAEAFPVAANTQTIPNSFRFPQAIADFANPLGVVPCGLQGRGPKPSITAKPDQNVIFLFNEDTGKHVLGAYARHLSATFSEEERSAADFVAVGYVHKPGEADKFPRSVGNYWEQYDWQTPPGDPRPATFFQFASMAKARASTNGSAAEGVTLISNALIQLGRCLNPTFRERPKSRPHRFIDEKLRPLPQMRVRYQALQLRFAPDAPEISEAEWLGAVRAECLAVAAAISDAIGGETEEARTFLSWPNEITAPPDTRKKSSNEFIYPLANSQVKIRVGSINAVKGQTHTATLVLETFYKTHQLEALRPWLLGEKVGGHKERVESRRRLKTHYVAMTRPTHVLCLAMHDSFEAAQLVALRERGWRIARVGQQGDEWLLEA